MASSVHTGEESAHLSTQQWQSFEIRMRRRRVERLLARVEEACQSGREDTAREAIAEIEQLTPHEPRLPELRSRVEAIAAIAPLPTPPAVIASAPSPTAPHPPEFTRPNQDPPLRVQNVTREQIRSTSPETVLLAPADVLLDLPLTIDEDVDAIPSDGPQRTRSGRSWAVAAMALLVCGIGGYLLGPRLMTLAQLPNSGGVPPADTTFASTQQPRAAAAADGTSSREALPPVQVAVDEVPAANTTLERAPESAQPAAEAFEPSSTATEPTTSTEPTTGSSTTAAAAPVHTEPAAPPPNPVVTREPDATDVKPPIAPPVETTNSVPAIPASSSPTPIEPGAPVTAPPAPREPAPSAPPRETPVSAPSREPAASAALEEEQIRGVLDQYASAYSRLDAAAASAIFPGVDQRALARAFEGLSSQKVSLGACDVRLAIETAIVDCAGTATWTPKIGGGTRTEPRRWQFRLRDVSGGWQIVAVKVR